MLKFNWNFLFTLINLVVFFLIMRKFLFKPIMNVLNKRKEMIENQFSDAEHANEQAQELKTQYEEKIENINAESNQIINRAKESARAEYDKIMNRAEADAENLKAAAKRQADAAVENEMRTARENIAGIAIDAAVKVLGANVSPETDSSIFDEFLNEGSEENESQN